MDASILSTFYDLPDGVLILSIIENSGAEKAGLLANDIITSINGIQILSPLDFQKTELIPGEIANVSVLRDGQVLQFPVEVIPSPEDPERGLIGIMRDNSFAYKPVLNFIEWNDPNVSMFLLWLWMISFFIGIIKHSFSPEYFRVYAAWFSHLSHFIELSDFFSLMIL